MSTPCRPPIELTITVNAQGTGSATHADFRGRIEDYAVNAPSDQAVWSIDFTETNLDGRVNGRAGAENQTGDVTTRDPFQVWFDLTVTLRNSTPGVYYVTLWHKK